MIKIQIIQINLLEYFYYFKLIFGPISILNSKGIRINLPHDQAQVCKINLYQFDSRSHLLSNTDNPDYFTDPTAIEIHGSFLLQKFAKQLAKCICECESWTNVCCLLLALLGQCCLQDFIFQIRNKVQMKIGITLSLGDDM